MLPRIFSSKFRLNDTQSCGTYINNPESPYGVAAPTYSQCFRWFRKKKYHSGIIPYYDYYYFMIKDFNKGPEYNSRHFESDDLRELSFEEAEITCLEYLIELVESKSE
jgi:hypothetical protein